MKALHLFQRPGVHYWRRRLERVLRSIYTAVLDSCETWAAIRPHAIDHREYASAEEVSRDDEKQSDLFNAPLSQAEYWQAEYWQAELELNFYDEVAPLLNEALAEQRLTLAPGSAMFKRLARKALWVGICAYHDFARTPRPIPPEAALADTAACLAEPAAVPAAVPATGDDPPPTTFTVQAEGKAAWGHLRPSDVRLTAFNISAHHAVSLHLKT